VEPTPATPDEPQSNSLGNSSQLRDQLANERTYLAWLRTSIAMMALGLAAAKFGSPNLHSLSVQVACWLVPQSLFSGMRPFVFLAYEGPVL
jgi:uncharacterized membrane protein YidH (DUF202 family)